MTETCMIGQFSKSPFVMNAASDREYERVAAFIASIRREKLPDDPPISLEEFIQNWKNYPDFIEEEAWIIWDAQQDNVAGFSRAWVEHTGDNEHICEFDIMLLQQYRCQGNARQLLRGVVDFAHRKGDADC